MIHFQLRLQQIECSSAIRKAGDQVYVIVCGNFGDARIVRVLPESPDDGGNYSWPMRKKHVIRPALTMVGGTLENLGHGRLKLMVVARDGLRYADALMSAAEMVDTMQSPLYFETAMIMAPESPETIWGKDKVIGEFTIGFTAYEQDWRDVYFFCGRSTKAAKEKAHAAGSPRTSTFSFDCRGHKSRYQFAMDVEVQPLTESL
jgi:hypothetical protein